MVSYLSLKNKIMEYATYFEGYDYAFFDSTWG